MLREPMFQDFCFVLFSCSGSFNIPSFFREVFYYGNRWSPWKRAGSWWTGRPYSSQWSRFTDLWCKYLLMVTQGPTVCSLKADASYVCVDTAENIFLFKIMLPEDVINFYLTDRFFPYTAASKLSASPFPSLICLPCRSHNWKLKVNVISDSDTAAYL